MPENQPMVAAVVQMSATPDVAANLAAVDRLTAEAAEQGAALIALPEAFVAKTRPIAGTGTWRTQPGATVNGCVIAFASRMPGAPETARSISSMQMTSTALAEEKRMYFLFSSTDRCTDQHGPQ